MWRYELDLMILMDPLRLQIFCDWESRVFHICDMIHNVIVGHVGSATEPLSPQSTIPLGLHVEGSSGVCCSVMRYKFSCWCPSGLACGGAAMRKADFSEAVKAWAANSRLPEI